MGKMTEKPVKIVELLEDTLGMMLNDVIYIYKIDHRYMIHRRETLCASFKLKPLPGQCGVAMLYNVWVDSSIRRQHVGYTIVEAAIKIAKEQDYTSMMITILKEDKTVLDFFVQQFKFKLLYQFRNERTKNAVLVLEKSLAK